MNKLFFDFTNFLLFDDFLQFLGVLPFHLLVLLGDFFLLQPGIVEYVAGLGEPHLAQVKIPLHL